MKNQILQNAITEIDCDLIDASDVKVTPIHHKTVFKWASVAVAACLALVGAFTVVPQLTNHTLSNTIGENNGEGVGDPNYHGDEIGLYEVYKYAVDSGEFASFEMGRVIKDDKIGAKLADVNVTAGWIRENVWLKNEHARAEIYKITGVSRNTAVAIKFLDQLEAQETNCYYVLINPSGDTASVQAYIIVKEIPEMNDGNVAE